MIEWTVPLSITSRKAYTDFDAACRGWVLKTVVGPICFLIHSTSTSCLPEGWSSLSEVTGRLGRHPHTLILSTDKREAAEARARRSHALILTPRPPASPEVILGLIPPIHAPHPFSHTTLPSKSISDYQ